MHMPTESKKRSRRAPDVAKFEIVGIEVEGIPSVRVNDQPVEHPPKPTPTPEPPPPPPGE
jgi:hypothetical protein